MQGVLCPLPRMYDSVRFYTFYYTKARKSMVDPDLVVQETREIQKIQVELLMF